MPPNRVSAVDHIGAFDPQTPLALVYKPGKDALASDAPTKASQSRHDPSQDYWTWRAESDTPDARRQRTILQILADEEARILLSTEHMQACEVAGASSGLSEAVVRNSQAQDEDYWFFPPTEDDVVRASESSSHDAYWDWQSMTSQQERQQAIDDLLLYEAVRQQLSIEHIESGLVRAKTDVPRRSVPFTDESAAYWAW